MNGLQTIAHRMGCNNRRFILPMLALAVVLPLSLMSAGCGSESRAATSEKEDATADAKASEEASDSDAKGKDGKTEETEKVAIPVSVASVEPGVLSAYLTATANLVAENEVKIIAESEGRVERMTVDEGVFVQKGQLIASLNADDETIALAKAEVRLTNAKMAFGRGEDLAAKELISREEMDKLQMEFEIAEQEIAEAQWRVKKTEIRAPFSGQISERMIQLGQHVRSGDELFQLTDFHPLIARIYFPESDIIGLESGRSVHMSLNADPSVQFEGRIRHISDVVDAATGTVKITVEAPAVPKGVRPGSFVAVNIVRERRADVLKLPKEAVIRELRSAHVFVAKDSIAERREVTLGLEDGDFVEAIDGVASGEQVIVLGQGGLKHGSEIQILTPTGQEVRES